MFYFNGKHCKILKTDYTKKYEYYYWRWKTTPACDWTDSYIASTNDRKVETRTLYRYNMESLGHNFTNTGTKTFMNTAHKVTDRNEICYVLGSICTRCQLVNENPNYVKHSFTTAAVGGSGWTKHSDTASETVWRAYCNNGCGCWLEEKIHKCQHMATDVIPPTCTTQSTTITTDFADITLIDTVSAAFTLTSEQETMLRKTAIETLGITNDDIVITRYADGTTEIKLMHIDPVATENGDEVNYVIDFDFSVTANEKALVEDSYATNTENAGIIIGADDVYENNFEVPYAHVENADGVVYFTVNGIVYQVVRVHKGDTLEAPAFTLGGEYTFSGWDIPDEVVFEGGSLTVDATLTQAEYTVAWNTADGAIVDSYRAGDIIVAPKVLPDANGSAFVGWDAVVPVVMPGENLVFTAVYGDHEHAYADKLLVKVSCGVEGKILHTCICGDEYIETVEALSHKWFAISNRENNSNSARPAYSFVYCENCGHSPDVDFSYRVEGTVGKTEVVWNLSLVDANKVLVQPENGSIEITLPVPKNMRNARNIKIYRVEDDGRETDLNGTVENGYITFTTTHFSTYILRATYDCTESGKHPDANEDYICDVCENHSHSACLHFCHTDIPWLRMIWTFLRIVYQLFGVNPTCECGAAHY